MQKRPLRPNQLIWNCMPQMKKGRGPDEATEIKQCKSIPISRKTAQRAGPERRMDNDMFVQFFFFWLNKPPVCMWHRARIVQRIIINTWWCLNDLVIFINYLWLLFVLFIGPLGTELLLKPVLQGLEAILVAVVLGGSYGRNQNDPLCIPFYNRKSVNLAQGWPAKNTFPSFPWS